MRNTCIGFLDKLPYFTVRILARLTGKIMSLIPVFGDICRLLTRHMYLVIQQLENPLCVSEIVFWRDNISSFNSRSLYETFAPTMIVFSDASSI